MLKKLRIQFVVIIMASVAVVLAIVFTGICVSDYQRSMGSVNEALANAIDRSSEDGVGKREAPMPIAVPFVDGFAIGPGDGFDEGLGDGFGDGFDEGLGEGPGVGLGEGPGDGLGEPEGERVRSAGGGEGQALAFPGDLSNDDAPGGPRIGGMRDEGRAIIPVAVYALDSSGSYTSIPRYATASIDDELLAEASSPLLAAQDGTGELSDLGLFYEKRTVDGFVYVAFADSAYASSWRSLALSLAVAGLLTLAVFFVIALLLSRWALKPVEEAWTAQRQFVADASHELKTPLTVVLANMSILLKHPEATIANQSQWIESTQVEAESMQGLVNEMLELAQVESRASVQHVKFDFSDLVSGQTLQFESVAFERGCRLEGSIAEGVAVSGDEARLGKMTSTLIENALKYVDEGGLVEVILSADGNRARMTISNTGSTISPEDLPHIFDRFYRTDKARTSGAGGFGLGLAIAREIAREHEGDIACDSDAGGTSFTVTLPIA